MIIDFDLTQVPDKVLPVNPGVYTFVVNEITVKDPKNPKPESPGKSVEVQLVIATDGPLKGRHMTDWIWISQKPMTPEEKAKSLIQIKRFARSAGLTPESGLNILSLKGMKVRARVVSRVYKDDAGNQKEGTEIAEYLIPGDNGYDA